MLIILYSLGVILVNVYGQKSKKLFELPLQSKPFYRPKINFRNRTT
jgi:hypothetical protein